MSIRTFTALTLDPAVRERIVAAARDVPPRALKVRWVRPENLHVTLKFLGDVPEADAADVCAAVAAAAEGIAPFDFDLVGLRCVPPGRRTRMVWADVREPTGQLEALFQAVESAVAPLGYAPETRAFRPHVTVGRVRAVRDLPALREGTEAAEDVVFGAQHAGEVVVYGSELTREGPVYTPLTTAPLAEP